ncbi:condensation domain-containing protein [Jatrophihabitans sp.]|uniref:condensation domain-containing protein n=1 Tax=Jatrophihabitans sp. TaxID=1932789 RepID=UPI002B73A77A|nr:condensation domain-containing protein [Jatrophihabitans sp.]
MTADLASTQDRRQELRDLLIRRRRAELAGGVVAVGRDGLLPLSWQQLGLWFLYQWDPESATYHLPLVLRLRGRLDRAALAAAVRAVLLRHEGLRTRFVIENGQPWQLIDPPPTEVDVPVADLPQAGWQRSVAEQVRRPFRLLAEPGFRWWLGRLSDEDHVLVLNCHHILTDGWSVGILSADLGAAYRQAKAGNGPVELPVLAVQPADHAMWQRQHRDQLNAGLSYWTEALAGLPTLRLPADRLRPAVPTGAGAGLGSSIDQVTATGLTALAGRLRVSPLAVLLAGFTAVLHRYTGQADLPVGSIFSGRTRTELEPLVGYFANTVVLRTRISGQASVTSHIQHCHATILAALQHQDTPFTLLVDTLRPPRVPGQNPLFQISLSLLPAAIGAELRLADLSATPVGLTTSASRFDLAVQVAPQADGTMSVWAEYSTELFEAERIERLLSHFTAALAELVADSSRPLEQLLMLDETSRKLVDGPFRTGTAAAPALDRPRQPAPGSATLPALTAVWTELLTPATPLQPHDNFFTLGGSSLALARLTTAIQERCGVQVTVRDLYLAPTLDAMASLIDERAADRSSTPTAGQSALLPLRTGGYRPPLFLVHAIGGSAASYLPLVGLLSPAQPIYAFEASSVRPGSTIASIAAQYLAEVRAVQPHGPYRLAGWSVGGVIAQQLAVNLRSAGEDVGLLALLDAVPSEPGSQVPDRAGLLGWFLRDLAGIQGGRMPMLDTQLLRDLPESEQLARAIADLVAQGTIDEADQASVATRFEVFGELARAFLQHRPTPLDCPTELLVAARGAVDPIPRWQAVGGPLIVHHVPGNHYTMLQPPHLGLVAAVLNQLLLRSCDRHAHRAMSG